MNQRQPRKQELRSKPLHIQVSNIKKNSKSVSIIRVNTIVLNGVLMITAKHQQHFTLTRAWGVDFTINLSGSRPAIAL